MRSAWIAIMLLLAGAGAAHADAAAEVKAGTGIEDREPTGVASSFKKGDTVFVWSNITEADGQTVEHAWKLDGKEVFKVSFEVKSKRWRVNSRRRNLAAGAYVVEVTADDGKKKLGEVSFKVE